MATFKFYGRLKDNIPDGQTVVNGNGDISETLAGILDEHPPLKEMLAAYQDTYQIVLNGEMVQFLDDGMETRLEEEDVVQVFPPVSGGKTAHGIRR